MLGMKKRTPAGHAAVGIILTAALLFAGGCGTNTQNQTAGSTVSEQTSELTSEQASEQGSGKMAKYVPTKADEVQNPVLYLDGDPVSQEEYAMLAQQYKNQIMMKPAGFLDDRDRRRDTCGCTGSNRAGQITGILCHQTSGCGRTGDG